MNLEWVTGGFRLTATQNTTTSARSGTVIVTAGTVTRSFNVSQVAGPAVVLFQYTSTGHTTGSPPTSHSIIAPGSITLKQPGMTRLGYKFGGWNNGGNTFQAGQTFQMTPAQAGTYSFDAKWDDFHGIKSYVTDNRTSVNCQGYAFFTNNWPSSWFSLCNSNLTCGTCDACYWYNPSTTTTQALQRTKDRMPTYLNASFPNSRWRYGTSMSTPLNTDEWMVVMRIGKHKDIWGIQRFDFHYWYRTDVGQWAHKRGETASQHLAAGTTPLNNQLSAHGISDFYNSGAVYYIVK